MADSSADPFDWSVDQVVYEFCRNPQPTWFTNNNTPRVTNTAALEQALRQNDISGEPLLVLVNQDILKDELGIMSLGERYHIMRAIESLRSLSPKYHLYRRDQCANFQPSGPVLGGGFMSPQITQSNVSAYPFSSFPVHHNGDLRSRHTSPSKRSVPELPPLFNTPRTRREGYGLLNTSQVEAAPWNGAMMLQPSMAQPAMFVERQAGNHPSTPLDILEAGNQGTRSDAQEFNTLGLAKDQAPGGNDFADNRNRSVVGASEVMEASEQIKPSKVTVIGGRKRLAPTFVSHISKRAVAPPAGAGTDRERWYYLRPDGMGPEDVFYPAAFVNEDENEEFTHTDSGSFKGQSSFVARLMRYYYRQPVLQLPDSKALAKIPYSRSTLEPGDPQYFTMFVPGLEPAVHDLSHWPGIAAHNFTKGRGRVSTMSKMVSTTAEAREETEEEKHHDDDYDYLLEKYPPKDEDEDVLALYGDSGDEGVYDFETWNEIEQDRLEAELEKNSGAMSKGEVEAAIDEAVNQIIAEWSEQKLARAQLKGYRLWVRANSNGRRQAEMNNAHYWIHRYDQTIRRMRETITKDVWLKAADVKQQCKIFDEAVAQREEYQYFVTVLGALEAPTRPDVEALRKRDRPRRADVPDGEEILESDSDLGDFIVNDDSSDAGSIPHNAAEYADAMEFVGPEVSADSQQDTPKASKDVDSSLVPVAVAEVDETTIEGDHESVAPVGLEIVTEEVHKAAYVSDMVEDDIMVQEAAYVSDIGGDDIMVQAAAYMSDISEDDIISSARKVELSRWRPQSPTIGAELADSLVGADETEGTVDSSHESDLDAPATLPKTKYRPFGRTVLSPVDLTLSSSPSAASPISESQRETSSDYQVHTPELNPIPTTPANKKLKLTLKTSNTPHPPPSSGCQTLVLKLGSPSLSDIPGIKALAWEFLEERDDRIRILAKLVYNLKRNEARKIQAHIQKLADAEPDGRQNGIYRHVAEGEFLDQIRNGLEAISEQTDVVDGISKAQNVQKIVRRLALLFASFANHTNLMQEERTTRPLLRHALDDLQSLIKSFFRNLILTLGYFCKSTEIKQPGSKRKAGEDDQYKGSGKDDQDDAMLDSDEDREAGPEVQEPAAPSSIKKRKRKVHQSQEALSQQRSDQYRVQEEERRKALADMRLANMGITGDDPAGHAVAFGEDGEPQIFLHEHIGKRVKPHQVDGIQFMWREIITDPKRQGCLLAHTMGLGKTMQVISLLVTIALSAKSDEDRVRDKVPEHLRETKTLILCPPSLIDNWHDELLMWRPNSDVLGKLYKIQSSPGKSDGLVRSSMISQWANKGGVMIVSYELFRKYILNEGKKLSEEQHKQVKQDLLDRPTIVVADEAHKMKNAGAKITQVASRFKTISRIALTGSPLANNLEEYHTMIDWIAPGYLGTIVQFRAKYSDPISYGLYEDSTSRDKRTSLRKLITLGRDLEPKLNRADITAIEKDMPPKAEFFITIPLTKLQIKAYNIYARALLKGNGTNNTSNARLWQWLHVLGLLCNHPLSFVNKLDERRYALEQKAKPREKEKMAGTDESQGEALPTDVVLSDIGLSPDEIEKALMPFRKLDEEDRLEDPALSNRSLIVSQIVAKSLEIGDKVLIFSHTIPTLNYLEKMLESIEGCNTCRIDGETKMSTRQESTKTFNKQESEFNVFLISMKAGGLGLNLQGANRVIIYDFSFNPTWEDQAIGRAYRLGQKKPVYVYRFRAGGTFEDITYNKAIFKTTLFSRVVDKKNYMSQAKKSLSTYLFEVKDVEQRSLEDSLGKDPDVLDRIVQCTKCIRNIELTETFQKEDDEELSKEELQLAAEEYEEQRMQRDDPAAYARKQATKVAQQMQYLGTNPGLVPPGPAGSQVQSLPHVLSASALTQNVVNGPYQAQTNTWARSPPFNPEQAAIFGHRAPTTWSPPHPFHQELVSDAAPVQYTTQQPPRAFSAGPEQLPQTDGIGDETEPHTADAKHNYRNLDDDPCVPQ